MTGFTSCSAYQLITARHKYRGPLRTIMLYTTERVGRLAGF